MMEIQFNLFPSFSSDDGISSFTPVTLTSWILGVLFCFVFHFPSDVFEELVLLSDERSIDED